MNGLYYEWASFVDYLIGTYGREKFDENGERLPRPRWRHFDKIDGGGNAQGHSDDKSDDRGDQCAKDKGQGAELFSNGIPF